MEKESQKLCAGGRAGGRRRRMTAEAPLSHADRLAGMFTDTVFFYMVLGRIRERACNHNHVYTHALSTCQTVKSLTVRTVPRSIGRTELHSLLRVIRAKKVEGSVTRKRRTKKANLDLLVVVLLSLR